MKRRGESHRRDKERKTEYEERWREGLKIT